MCSVAEKPTADDLQPQTGQTARVTPAMLAARRRKETLLPEITQLALEGHASQAIADKLGMPKRTVNYWLQEARQEWIARAALGAAEMFAADLRGSMPSTARPCRPAQLAIRDRRAAGPACPVGRRQGDHETVDPLPAATGKCRLPHQGHGGRDGLLAAQGPTRTAVHRCDPAGRANRSRWRAPSRGCGERGPGAHERRSAPRLPRSAVCHHRCH